MNRKTLFKLIILFQSFLYSSEMVSQSENSRSTTYYSDEIDYFPHFKSQFRGGHSSGGEILSKLQGQISECKHSKLHVSEFSGFVLRTSGIFPKALEGRIWFTLDLDEKGSLTMLKVNPEAESENYYHCIEEIFNNQEINPALRDGKGVRCRLIYTIDTE